jgi:beta-lactamase superfamily II metal-dependent hydrolase
MYRIGHGDCFLVAFAGNDEKPVYLMIDCGYKPGSPVKMASPTTITEITDDIRAATGGHIDIFVVTHEHQDHLNGITEKTFAGLTIGEAWFSWTDDPSDPLAAILRKRFKENLEGIAAARLCLETHDDRGVEAAAGAPRAADQKRKSALDRVDELLALEYGGDVDIPPATLIGLLGADMSPSANKRSMNVIKDRAAKGKGSRYLRPHEPVEIVPGTADVRFMVLGPPHNETQLFNLDPHGPEVFQLQAFKAAAASTTAGTATANRSPFAAQFCAEPSGTCAEFFKQHYPDDKKDDHEPWRRIDVDWQQAAEQLALAMNKYTNNSSLVLAFELGRGGKVLLFAADAQTGNWLSWADKDFADGRKTITTRDIMARTVFLKVGHHGSHNATLNGTRTASYPNLDWIATGSAAAREFTSMITAVRKWAETQNGWDHPKKAIKDALLAKSGQRLLQTDEAMSIRQRPDGQEAEWAAFKDRTRETKLYFDVTITR